MKTIALLLAVLSVFFTGCGQSEKEQRQQQLTEARKAKEEEFYTKGPRITAEVRTGEGVLQTIEIPIRDVLPRVKRCVLFIGKNNAQTMTCEEPDYVTFE